MNTALTFDLAAEINALIAAAPAVVTYEIRGAAGRVALQTWNEREARDLARAWNDKAGRKRYRVVPV